jgi:tungstate transport system substrate-binding protein
VGPPPDPARIATASNATDAMRRIARARARFASRGDDSGTNAKELELWDEAGVKPKGPWYVETGQGMGQTLTIASQKRAYTLSDRGTYLATKNLDLKILTQGGAELQNRYHEIVVKGSGLNTGCAKAFDRWIRSAPTQRLIGRFGVRKYGQRLFVPDAR